MNAGAETVEWLYNEQLRVDDEWAVRTPTGFIWWPDKHAQTIEVIGENPDPDGETEYLVSVRTDVLYSLDMDDQAMEALSTYGMHVASMAGPVYDPEDGSVELCSLVKVYDGISDWMNPLIGMAAVLQLAEARLIGQRLAEMLDAEDAISGHPDSGFRSEPDEILQVIGTIVLPMGTQPSRWPDEEFEQAAQYFHEPPAIIGSSGGPGFTVEFPYRDKSSLLQGRSDQRHPRFGNGLLMVHSFPISIPSQAEGTELALTLNELELTDQPTGYGFGSYVHKNDTLYFASFIPNAAYIPGLLPNLFFASAARARQIAVSLGGQDWTEDSFSLDHSALGRATD